MLIPTSVIGVYLLYILVNYPTGYKILYAILGAFIILAALNTIFTNNKPKKKSPMWEFYFFTSLTGLLGGLFSASGPAMVYLLYRQPWSVNGIRRILLTTFFIVIIMRIITVAIQGEFNWDIWIMFFTLLPTVFIATLLARKYLKYANPNIIRKSVTGILLLSGVNILYKAITL